MSIVGPLFVVRSGSGYFIKFINESNPYLTSDPLEAARLTSDEAMKVIGRFIELGYSAGPVEIVIGQIKVDPNV